MSREKRDALGKRMGMTVLAKWVDARSRVARELRALRDSSGQGTTEYAILVGVLVVIAIAAIIVFKPKIQELWDAISEGITSL